MSSSRTAQSGVMLLEALVGLLIFSLGVLALVAMQSVAISNVSNAKYRVEAAFYAEEIMNAMWLDPANIPTYKFPGGSAPYVTTWYNRVTAAGTGLPGATTYPPVIAINQVVTNPGLPTQQTVNQVTVTIRWKAPEALAPSNHVAMTYINNNN